MSTITISEKKLHLQNSATVTNMIVVAVIFALLLIFVSYLEQYFLLISLVFFLSVAYSAWILFEFILHFNQLEIDFEQNTLVQQSKLGVIVYKRVEITGISPDSFSMSEERYHRGLFYFIIYDNNSENPLWQFQHLAKARQVKRWLNSHRTFPMEIS